MQTQTIHIHRRALTEGIRVVEAAITPGGWARIVKGPLTGLQIAPSAWCASREEAIRTAEELRQRRVQSLRDQLGRLEKLAILIHEVET